MGNDVSHEVVNAWTAEEVAALLGGVGPAYTKYSSTVISNTVDGPMLLQLGEEVRSGAAPTQ